MTSDIQQQTQALAQYLTRHGDKICCAESCTGGLIAKTLTDLAGSSDWFDRGFVTYSNAAGQSAGGRGNGGRRPAQQ